jgi:hypothetical protein
VLKQCILFCDPGYVPEEELGTILHTCLETHLIPYRNATFLTHNYCAEVRQVYAVFVRNPRVVLINKGSAESPTVMNLQAIRWLYAVALWQQHHYGDVATLATAALERADSPAWIPGAADIRCFDVSVLEAAAAECSALAEERTTDAHAAHRNGKTKLQAKKLKGDVRKPQCCWYHDKVETAEVLIEGEVHCALRDAEALAQRVRTALNKWHPGRKDQ